MTELTKTDWIDAPTTRAVIDALHAVRADCARFVGGCVRNSIMGREVVVAITNGKLDFGPWEAIFYYELDGKRRKRALVKIIGE